MALGATRARSCASCSARAWCSVPPAPRPVWRWRGGRAGSWCACRPPTCRGSRTPASTRPCWRLPRPAAWARPWRSARFRRGSSPATSCTRRWRRRAGSRSAACAGTRAKRAVALQVALAVVLLVGGALLARSLWALERVPSGFVSTQVLAMDVSLSTATYAEGEQIPFYERLQQRIAAMPGVTAVGATNILPLSGNYDSRGVQIEDHPAGWPGRSHRPDRSHPATSPPWAFPCCAVACSRPAISTGSAGRAHQRRDGTPLLARRGSDRPSHHVPQRHSPPRTAGGRRARFRK